MLKLLDELFEYATLAVRQDSDLGDRGPVAAFFSVLLILHLLLSLLPTSSFDQNVAAFSLESCQEVVKIKVLVRRQKLLQTRRESQLRQRINMAEFFRQPARVLSKTATAFCTHLPLDSRQDLQLEHHSTFTFLFLAT